MSPEAIKDAAEVKSSESTTKPNHSKLQGNGMIRSKWETAQKSNSSSASPDIKIKSPKFLNQSQPIHELAQNDLIREGSHERKIFNYGNSDVIVNSKHLNTSEQQLDTI